MLKDKPPSLPIKEHLINYVIEELGMDDPIVSSVINWVMEDTQKSGIQKNSSVEISGFGTFIVWPKKLANKTRILKRTIEIGDVKKIESASEALKSLDVYGNKD